MQPNRPQKEWLCAVATAIGMSLLALAALTGCSDSPQVTGERLAAKDPNAPLSVYVANYPLGYFAERIGSANVSVGFPVPAGVDPAYWKPAPEEIAAYQSADIILLNGASYSSWVSYASLPLFRTVDTSAPFSSKYIPFKDKGIHSHGPDGEHEHGKAAFTTWLDPLQAIAQADTIREVLVSKRPEKTEDFNRGYHALAADLKDLDRRLAAAFSSEGAQPLIFSHPVYQYLIRRYGIAGESVHWEPDQEPSPEQRMELDKLLTEHPARWMIWEAAPESSTVEELKRRGLGSLIFDTCANVPEEGDFLSVMQQNARRVAEALAP